MRMRAGKTEADHQTALFAWAQLASIKHPELKLLYHVPNGGTRDPVEARHLKQQGVQSGVPDLVLPVARQGFYGLYIELKRPKPRGRLADNQKRWGKKLTEYGYLWRVCYGWQEARAVLEWYLGGAGECPVELPKDFGEW